MSNIDKIRQEIERRKKYESENYHDRKADGRPNDGWAESLAIMGELEELLSFIDSLPDENNPEPYNPVYDEGYLNEKIAKATKSWEGVDVNKMLADCRGYEEKPSEDLEEEIKNYFEGLWPGTETPEQCNTDLHFTPPAIVRLVRHFTEWQKEQMMKVSEEDALLLERAWLTLDGFGHEELAEWLRQFVYRQK